MSMKATFAPCRAKPSVSAAPMPEPPPVISTEAPSRSGNRADGIIGPVSLAPCRSGAGFYRIRMVREQDQWRRKSRDPAGPTPIGGRSEGWASWPVRPACADARPWLRSHCRSLSRDIAKVSPYPEQPQRIALTAGQAFQPARNVATCQSSEESVRRMPGEKPRFVIRRRRARRRSCRAAKPRPAPFRQLR